MKPVEIRLHDRAMSPHLLLAGSLLHHEAAIDLIAVWIVGSDPERLRRNLRLLMASDENIRVLAVERRTKQRNRLERPIDGHAEPGECADAGLAEIVQVSTGVRIDSVLLLPHPVVVSVEELGRLLGVLVESVLLGACSAIQQTEPTLARWAQLMSLLGDNLVCLDLGDHWLDHFFGAGALCMLPTTSCVRFSSFSSIDF